MLTSVGPDAGVHGREDLPARLKEVGGHHYSQALGTHEGVCPVAGNTGQQRHQHPQTLCVCVCV